MPMYEYACAKHGVFEAIKPIVESAAPENCPTCDHPSVRILSPGAAPRLAREVVRARDRNERSRHEPWMHAKDRSPRGDAREPKRPALQSYSGPRPWAIEHC